MSWRLSNTLGAGFCAEGLEEALGQGQPEVFNTDQGSQFTSWEFTQVLLDRGVINDNEKYLLGQLFLPVLMGALPQ